MYVCICVCMRAYVYVGCMHACKYALQYPAQVLKLASMASPISKSSLHLWSAHIQRPKQCQNMAVTRVSHCLYGESLYITSMQNCKIAL